MQNLFCSFLMTASLEEIETTLESIDSSMGSLEGILGSLAGVLGISYSILLFIVAVVVPILSFFGLLISYLLPAIALFKMAKTAGYKNAWFAFIPVLQTYLEFVLPRSEFRLLFVKTYKRETVAIVSILLTFFGTTVIGLLNVIPLVGQLLDLALAVSLVALSWKRMYDVILTFGDKEKAMILSIIGYLFPVVYSIALLMLMNKAPDYGKGQYYEVPMN